MLAYYWDSVADGGPTLNQHWVNQIFEGTVSWTNALSILIKTTLRQRVVVVGELSRQKWRWNKNPR